jgi:hypothetical protein
VINHGDVVWEILFLRVSKLPLFIQSLARSLVLLYIKALAIELLGNSFLFHNKLFLLIFVIELYHLFHNIWFWGTRRDGSFFGQFIVLFLSLTWKWGLQFSSPCAYFKIILEFQDDDNFSMITTTWNDLLRYIPSTYISYNMSWNSWTWLIMVFESIILKYRNLSTMNCFHTSIFIFELFV